MKANTHRLCTANLLQFFTRRKTNWEISGPHSFSPLSKSNYRRFEMGSNWNCHASNDLQTSSWNGHARTTSSLLQNQPLITHLRIKCLDSQKWEISALPFSLCMIDRSKTSWSHCRGLNNCHWLRFWNSSQKRHRARRWCWCWWLGIRQNHLVIHHALWLPFFRRVDDRSFSPSSFWTRWFKSSLIISYLERLAEGTVEEVWEQVNL